jgi:cysteine desulfurase/selenocysteine lyase
MDTDFFVFSSHKVYGPTGTGALYGKRELLEAMPPYQGGGEMIKDVYFNHITYNDLPYKFEAGTPNIADTMLLKLPLNLPKVLARKRYAGMKTTCWLMLQTTGSNKRP